MPARREADAFRCALGQPTVDLCTVGARSTVRMREDLPVLDRGPLAPDREARIRRNGDHIYGRRR